MYPDYMMKSIKMVERTRPKRLELAKKHGKQVFPGMIASERQMYSIIFTRITKRKPGELFG